MGRIFNQFLFPASILTTTIIGAGMFALPYLFNKAGIVASLFYLFFFGVVIVLIHLMYADIIVRTPENRRFSGYARIYFGELGHCLSVFMTIFGALLSLTIYLILSVSFVNLIVPVASGAPAIYPVLIFWLLGSSAIFFNVNRLAMSEFLVFIGMAAIIFTIFGFGLANGGWGKMLSLPLIDFSNIFIPFGAVLFSMYGRSAIPTLLGYFRNNSQLSLSGKWPIVIGSIAPAVVYLIFVFGIIGLSGSVSEDAVSGLVGNLPGIVLCVVGILGIISLWSTYIVIGRDIKKSLEHDFGAPLFLSGAAVVAVPILFYIFGFQNFLQLVEFTGAVIIGLEGIFIVLMWLKASKRAVYDGPKLITKLNPPTIAFLLLVFIAGIVYKIAY
jgi:amino acid permease